MTHSDDSNQKGRYPVKTLKTLYQLFSAMLKIGLFTFGGGYAMIPLLDNEFVTRRQWLDGDEFMDLVTIAESTPGPIAINCATYIGYKKKRLAGALAATLGMVLPSFTVIFLISLFFDRFLEISFVASAFRGIQVCVVYLILSAGVKMFKKIKKTAFSITAMSLTFTAMLAFSLFSVRFSSIFYILIFATLSLCIYAVQHAKRQSKEEEQK